MANLKKWLTAGYTVAPSGANAQNENGNGFIVYFSDRRNNKNLHRRCASFGNCGTSRLPARPASTGGRTWSTSAATGDGLTLTVFDPGEDVNGNERPGCVGQGCPERATALQRADTIRSPSALWSRTK